MFNFLCNIRIRVRSETNRTSVTAAHSFTLSCGDVNKDKRVCVFSKSVSQLEWMEVVVMVVTSSKVCQDQSKRVWVTRSQRSTQLRLLSFVLQCRRRKSFALNIAARQQQQQPFIAILPIETDVKNLSGQKSTEREEKKWWKGKGAIRDTYYN